MAKFTVDVAAYIRNASDAHLVKMINGIETIAQLRYGEDTAAGFSMLGTLQGDMAIMSVEQSLFALEMEGPQPGEIDPLYYDMVAEMDRRAALPRITDMPCACTCGWHGKVDECEPDVDGDGGLGCPECWSLIKVVVPSTPE